MRVFKFYNGSANEIIGQDGHVSVYSKEWLLARADGKSTKLKLKTSILRFESVH